MKDSPRITKVDAVTYEHTLHEVGKDYNTFNMVYEQGGKLTQQGSILRIHTDQGIVGEYAGNVGGPALAEVKAVAGYLIGRDALARESATGQVREFRNRIGPSHRAHIALSIFRATSRSSKWIRSLLII